MVAVPVVVVPVVVIVVGVVVMGAVAFASSSAEKRNEGYVVNRPPVPGSITMR